MTEEIREAFEKCMSKDSDIDLRRTPNGQYYNYILNHQLKIFHLGWEASKQASQNRLIEFATEEYENPNNDN